MKVQELRKILSGFDAEAVIYVRLNSSDQVEEIEIKATEEINKISYEHSEITDTWGELILHIKTFKE